MQSLLPRDTLLRTYLTSLQLVIGTTASLKLVIGITIAGDWDCVAAVERLPALHYSVDFNLFSFGIMGFIVEL